MANGTNLNMTITTRHDSSISVGSQLRHAASANRPIESMIFVFCFVRITSSITISTADIRSTY